MCDLLGNADVVVEGLSDYNQSFGIYTNIRVFGGHNSFSLEPTSSTGSVVSAFQFYPQGDSFLWNGSTFPYGINFQAGDVVKSTVAPIIWEVTGSGSLGVSADAYTVSTTSPCVLLSSNSSPGKTWGESHAFGQLVTVSDGTYTFQGVVGSTYFLSSYYQMTLLSPTTGAPLVCTSLGSGTVTATTTVTYNTVAGFSSYVTPVNSAVLVTNGSGVPSESTTLPSALTIPSPALTGTPTAPTAALGTNTTQLATMAALQAATPSTLCSFSAESAANTGSTTENAVTGYSCAIPAGTMGTTSRLEGRFYLATGGANTGNCILRMRWYTTSGSTSGTQIGSSDQSGTNQGGWSAFDLYNTGSQTAQRENYFGYGNVGGNVIGANTAALNTGTTITYVYATLQNTVSGDNCYVMDGHVTLWPNG